jgi:hypothetical protein
MVTPFVTSLLHFDQNKLFKDIVYILALFGLLGLLFKKLGNFFLYHLVTVSQKQQDSKFLKSHCGMI